jgi:hypothetical protein
MAREWEQLAEQQKHATDLRKKDRRPAVDRAMLKRHLLVRLPYYLVRRPAALFGLLGA